MNDIWFDALIKANKAGARNLKVVGYVLPTRATEDNCIKLIFEEGPDALPATEKAWYDE